MFLLPDNYWEIREIQQKGRGVFARHDLLPGTVVGDYQGKIMADESIDDERYGLYSLYFNHTHSIVADKDEIGIHLMNHSCSANCGMFPYMGHMLFFVNRYIFAGEELTLQYLMSPHDPGETCNHVCYCHSPVCHGDFHISVEKDLMIERFFSEKDGAYREKLPVPAGMQLPRLTNYPQIIEDDPIFDIFGTTHQMPYLCKDTSMPTIGVLRRTIREHGKILHFTNLNTYIYGVWNGMAVCMDEDTIRTWISIKNEKHPKFAPHFLGSYNSR